jgi:hypothetical protein
MGDIFVAHCQIDEVRQYKFSVKAHRDKSVYGGISGMHSKARI